MIKQPFKEACLVILLFFCFFEDLQSASLLSKDMYKLCSIAETTAFTPLVESIRSPNKDPLLNGIEFGSDFDETTKLLAGRLPDSIIIQEATPLIYAAITGNLKAVDALLNAGANINYESSIGTPLMMAAFNSKFPMVCSLIARGAKLPILTDERNQLLRHSLAMNPWDAELGSIFIEYLIENGFDVNDMGSQRETPLMGVVALHNIPAIKVLLKHGARLDIGKQGGRTVWTVAREKNNPQVIKLLKEAEKAAAQKSKTSDQKELVAQ